jgi:hypothetical protein
MTWGEACLAFPKTIAVSLKAKDSKRDSSCGNGTAVLSDLFRPEGTRYDSPGRSPGTFTLDSSLVLKGRACHHSTPACAWYVKRAPSGMRAMMDDADRDACLPTPTSGKASFGQRLNFVACQHDRHGLPAERHEGWRRAAGSCVRSPEDYSQNGDRHLAATAILASGPCWLGARLGP